MLPVSIKVYVAIALLCSLWSFVLRWRRGGRESAAEEAVLLGLAALTLREAFGFVVLVTSIAVRLLGLQLILALLAVTVFVRAHLHRRWPERLAVLLGYLSIVLELAVIRRIIVGVDLDNLPEDFRSEPLLTIATVAAWLAVAIGFVLLFRETLRWRSRLKTSEIAASEQ